MTDVTHAGEGLLPSTRNGARKAAYLFGPAIDFWCLGGGSIVVIGLIALLLPKGLPGPQTAQLGFVLVMLITHPHFANSYQMFYRNFGKKAFGASYPRDLRLRYLFAGIVVPAVLAVLLGGGLAMGFARHSTRLLGYLIASMLFLAAWHYVKQGYGILMVDCAQKRVKFADRAKLLFRANAYACWIVAWLEMNHAFAVSHQYFGVNYLTLPIPSVIYILAVIVCVGTTIAVAGIFFRRWRETRALPWNGVFAYAASLYLWVIFGGINPLMFVVVPMFHSLQYIVVVWRYQLNATASGAFANGFRIAILDKFWPYGPMRRLAVFVAFGLLLGFLGFDGIPQILDYAIPYNRAEFGHLLFMFVFSLFISVHHYFVDNVIWRRGNPDVQQYLFARRQ